MDDIARGETGTEEKLKERTRKLSLVEASSFSLHEGFGVRYITPFALAIGKGNSYVNLFIGLLSSVPSLLGNLSQLLTFRAVERYKRKKILFFGVILQALSWLLIIFSGVLYFWFDISSNLALSLLVVSFTIMALVGSFVGPVWVSLMKDNVPKNTGDYFGKRNMIAGIFALVSVLIAGWLLDYLTMRSVFLGFLILFSVAFLFRFICAILFLFHYEPPLNFDRSSYFSFYKFVKKIPSSNFGRFTLFVSLFILSTSVSAPFFSVYMLKNLGFSYVKWTITVVAVSASSLFFMPLWGRFADSYGNIRTLKITGALIPIIPLLWLFTIFFDSSSLWLLIYLIIIEIFSGVLWAGFNLSASNFIYDAVSRQKTTLCSSYYNILQGIGVFIGASIGGLISSTSFVFFGLSSILFIFLLSGIMRFGAYFVLISKIKEVRGVKAFTPRRALNELTRLHIGPFLDVFNIKMTRPRPGLV